MMSDAHLAVRAGAKRRINILGRSTQGCLTCRKKHVKCDERKPECGRCGRLNLDCVFSATAMQTQNSISSLKPRSLKPRTRGLQGQGGNQSNYRSTEPPENSVSPYVHTDDLEEILLGDNTIEDIFSADSSFLHDQETTQSPASQLCVPNISRSWNLAGPAETDPLLGMPMTALTPISPSISQIPQSGSLVLGPDDHLALKFYRTSFALSQTLKDPDWSLPSLLLQSISKNKMAMHLALAVSFQHISAEQYSAISLFHFHEGFDLLRTAVIEGNDDDKISMLSSFYFAFVFTLGGDISVQRLEDLSLWSVNYIKKFALESIGSGLAHSDFETRRQQSQGNGGKDPGNLTIVARLTVWLYKEDVRSVIMGGPGYIGKQFQKCPEKMMNIWRFSRPALQLHWGILYPVSQSLDDLEMSQLVDMGIELLLLRYEVTAYLDSSVDSETSRGIEMWFQRIAIKYDLVFQIASSTLPLSRKLHSYSTVLVATFYALNLLLRRVRSSNSQQTDYLSVETSLLTAIQNCLTFNEVTVFEGTQWVLLIAAMEIGDIDQHNWLMDQIRIPQYRYAARRIWDFRKANIQMLFLQSAFV